MKTLDQVYYCQIPGEDASIWHLKFHLSVFEPREDVQTVIITGMGFEMGWFIPYLVERLIEQVVNHFNLDLAKLIWIEHYSSELKQLTGTDFSLVTFDEQNGRVQNPTWNAIAPKVVQLLINEQLHPLTSELKLVGAMN